MYLSPLIGVPALIAVAVVATSLFGQPSAKAAPRIAVTVSAPAYDLLAKQAALRSGADGRPLTVEQLIEAFARAR